MTAGTMNYSMEPPMAAASLPRARGGGKSVRRSGRERRHRLNLTEGTAASWLSLAAAPILATMAFLTGLHDSLMPGILCSATHASWFTGMVPMYALMTAFHAAPWLRLLKRR